MRARVRKKQWNSLGRVYCQQLQVETVWCLRCFERGGFAAVSLNRAQQSVRSGNKNSSIAMRRPRIDNVACPKCGTTKTSGRLSCCARGGAWFKNCGDVGDAKFSHSWIEGIQACKSKLCGQAEFCFLHCRCVFVVTPCTAC